MNQLSQLLQNNMKTNNLNNRKGFSSIIVILAVLAVVLMFVLYVYKLVLNTSFGDDVRLTQPTQNMDGKMMYEPLEEDETTPEEINNEAVDELDSILKELDEDVLIEDDLSDLEL